MRVAILTLAGIAFFGGAAWAQTPTPVMGEVSPPQTPRYHNVSVDPSGNLNVNVVTGGGGCVGTVATPCIVAGPDAAGVAPTKNPVAIAAFDGINLRRVLSDTSGRTIAVGAAADGAAAAGNPVAVGGVDQTNTMRHFSTSPSGVIAIGSQSATGDGQANNWNFTVGGTGGTTAPLATMQTLFNGSTWDRNFACTQEAAISVSAATDAVIISGVAATNIRICHIDFGIDSAQTITIRQGTGATCGTNTATLAGAYPAVISVFAMDYLNSAPLSTTVAARDVCLHFGAAVTAGGFVKYAQY